MIDLNVNPFYDDFDETKDFHKILFRPGYPVQSRELTQMQTILQTQIQRHADHVFKNGTVVIPGHIYYDNTVNYVLLEPTTEGLSVAQYLGDLVGKNIRGVTSGVNATVVIGAPETETEESALYLRYTSAGAINGVISNNTKFLAGENLICDELGLTVKVKNVTSYSGKGAIASIADGIYYINGYFVRVGAQTIILSKFTNKPTTKVGLEFHDEIIDEVDDATLYDNALGYSNFGAPGAARYKISLTLTAKAVDLTPSTTQSISDDNVVGIDDDIKFIDLLEVRNGEIQYIINDTKYAELERWLAWRTFDESGDYIVSEFGTDLAEYRSNDRGAWTAQTVYLQGDIVRKTVGLKTSYYRVLSDGISGQNEPVHTFGLKSDGSLFWSSVAVPRFNRGRNIQVASQSLSTQKENESKISITVSNGKAYIKGFEVKKDQKTSLVIDKAREFKSVNSSQAITPLTDYIEITNTNVQSLPDFATCEAITIKDSVGATIGKANVSSISMLTSSVYRLHVFNLVMNTGKDFVYHAKSVSGSGFAATLVTKTLNLPGTISTTGSTSVNGFGTNFDETLKPGASIVMAGVRYIVSTITNDVTMTLTTTPPVLNGVVMLLEYVDYIAGTPAVIKLPNAYIRSTRSEGGTIDTTYTSVRKVTLGAGGSYTVTGDEVLAPVGHLFFPAVSGTAIPITAIGGSVTAPAAGSIAVLVIKTNSRAKEKIKLLQTKTVVVTTAGIFQENGTTPISTSRFNTITSKTVNLTEADGLRLVRVAESSSSGSYVESGSIDITSHYTMDHGRREKFYDIATMTSNTGYRPKRPIKVTFEYFAHTAGDFFSVDSYQNISPQTIPLDVFNGETFSLRDCLDFRPRMDDAGLNFSGAGALVGEPSLSNSIVSLDYSYYLPRTDIIAMTNSGDIEVIRGVAADTPSIPEAPRDGLHLYNIFLSAYTDEVSKESINLVKIDHRRFTMQDIGNIERRLDNVESYVSLSQLEKDTASMKITDKYGLDRFKNGFFVDQFKDYNVSAASPESMFSADPANRELRPPFFRTNIGMKERNGFTDSTRLSNHYVVKENVALLPYTHTPLISQTVASRGEFINPFNVASFVGSMTIQPTRDTWIETSEANKTNTIEGNFRNTFSALNGATRNIFGSWDTSVTRSRFGRRGRGLAVATTNTRTVTSIVTSVRSRLDIVDRARTLENETQLPFMRRRPIVMAIEGMMPWSRVYPFFNKTDISAHTRSLTAIVLTNVNGSFETLKKSNVKADNQEYRTLSDPNEVSQSGSWFWWFFRRPTRRPQGRDIVYDRGEVLQNSETGGTAIVVGASTVLLQNNSTRHVIWVANVRGNWNTSNNIRGLSTGATATIESVIAAGEFGAALNTTSTGEMFTEFWIPEETFAAGSASLEVMDNPSGSSKESITTADAEYEASGKLQSWMNTITQERNASVSESVAGVSTQVTSSTVTTWHDPLAQTFILPKEAKSGAFLSGVTLYFHTKASGETKPVTVQLVETDNGYPSQKVLPYSKTIVYPSQITANAETPVGTFVAFPAPVFVKQGTEYALVVMTESFKYKIWISRMGERRTDNPALVVTEQPHMGSLFKSQNSSTWTPEQLEDMTFVLHHAKFDTSRTGVVTFENQIPVSQQLQVNPIGYTNSSAKVRVYHMNNGLRNGWNVSFTDMEAVGGTPGTTLVNGTVYTVSDVLMDSYVITMGGTFTGSTGLYGGDSVYAFGGIEYDTIQFAGETVPLQGVTYDHSFKSVGSTGADLVFKQFVQEEIMDFDTTRFVASNLIKNNAPFSGTPSIQYRVLMNSTDSYVSPIINLDSLSAVLISNRINKPLATDNVLGTTDIKTLTVLGTSLVSATSTSITLESVPLADAVEIGQYVKIVGNVTVEGFVTKEVFDGTNETLELELGAGSADPTTMNTTSPFAISIYTNNVREDGPIKNSAAARYVSQPVILANPSASLKLFFAASIQTDSDCEVYYRTSQSANSSVLEQTNWTKVDISYKKSVVPDDFIDQEYELSNIESFMAFQVKIVMLSSNKAQVPKFKDLRVIALA